MTIVILLLALAGASGQETAPESERVFTRIGPESGLSQNSIYDIIEDRQGFLWVSTSEGLNRYDGYGFIAYRHDPGNPESLPDNRVQTVYEDRSGTLWVGTFNGASRFDSRTGRFTGVTVEGYDPASGPLVVWQILEDNSGVMWLTTSAGVCQLDRQRLRARTYPIPKMAPRLHQDESGTIWAFAASASDTYRYDRASDRFVQRRTVLRDTAEPSTWPNLHSGRSGILWVGSSSGLAKASLSRNQLTPMASMPSPNSILEGSHGTTWLGNDRIYKYTPESGSLERFELERAGPDALKHVRTLFEDRAGTIWAGTLSGLYKWDPHARHFTHHTHGEDDPNTLSSRLVSAIIARGRGGLWVGTIGGGLNRVAPDWTRVTRFRHDPARRATLSHDVVWALHEDARGRLWIGTDDGLNMFDEATGRFRVARCPDDSYEGTLPESVSSIAPGDGDVLWLGLYGGRLAEFNTATFACRIVFVYPHGARQAVDAGSTVVYRDASGLLWVGAEAGGLQSFDPISGRSKHYAFNETGSAGKAARTVWAIHETSDGVFWLGTDLGLNRFDPARESLTRVWDPDLPSSVVYAIVEDTAHRLWLSTNNGICAWDPTRTPGDRFAIFTGADGLRNTEFNRRAALRSREGTVFFGGMEGLTSFDPVRTLEKNPVIPPIVLTEVETRSRAGARSIHPTASDPVTLSYKDYSLTFAFVALSFTNAAKNRYAYKLEGFDPDWIGPSTRRLAHYTNVSPGTYVFRVKGSNGDGVWNEEGAALEVVITPPFWERSSFRVLVLAAVAGLLMAAHRYRVQQILAIERIRRQVATDLHDDVGSALSQVAILSEVAKRDATPAAAALMTETADLARSMRESLSDIVWAVDPRKDRLTDLLHRMRHTALNSLESDGVRVEFRAPPDAEIERIGLSPDRRRHLLLIFKEAITNIGRHAAASHVSIDLVVRGRSLSLTVSDDGCGFETRSRTDGHGLQSMARRATELGAHLAIESTPAIGTTIRVDVPVG